MRRALTIKKNLLAIAFLLSCCTLLAQRPRKGDTKAPAKQQLDWLSHAKLVDLTHPFNKETVYWPTESGFQLQKGTAGRTPKGYFYAANRFAAAEHGGTHIDAPSHFNQDGQTVDEIPLSRLMGEAVVVDVSAQCADDADYEVGIADLRRPAPLGRKAPSAIERRRSALAHWLRSPLAGPQGVSRHRRDGARCVGQAPFSRLSARRCQVPQPP